MAVSSSVQPWNLRMPAGSAQAWTFTLTTQTDAGYFPYPVGAATWEYVARISPTDTSIPLFSVTTALTANGEITAVTSAVLSQVMLAISATATAAITPGTYYHCLWMNPGTAAALAVFDGNLLIAGAPIPY